MLVWLKWGFHLVPIGPGQLPILATHYEAVEGSLVVQRWSRQKLQWVLPFDVEESASGGSDICRGPPLLKEFNQSWAFAGLFRFKWLLAPGSSRLTWPYWWSVLSTTTLCWFWWYLVLAAMTLAAFLIMALQWLHLAFSSKITWIFSFNIQNCTDSFPDFEPFLPSWN